MFLPPAGNSRMSVLVTGGAGYIGSHAVQRLLRERRDVFVVDNLFRGHRRAIDLLGEIAGGRLKFRQGDICDRAFVTSVLHESGAKTVLHFAALAYVGESVEDPLRYYRTNFGGTVSLLESCAEAGVDRFVFSSSCSTYGQPPDGLIPVPEDCPKLPLSPYGRSKLHCELLIEDFAQERERSGKPFSYACLRYFNVCGADRSGLLGEDHTPETHLIPVVIQAALGRREHIAIFGTDYPTPDGTCIRDYIHVEDLVDAHVRVMDALRPGANGADRRYYNLGIGKGYSVREIIDAVKRVSGREFKVLQHPRRAGDPPRLFADSSRIKRELGWNASITDLDEIILSAYKWFEKHPRGYGS